MIYTADIEAYQWTKFKTAGLYDGKEFMYFTDSDDFLDEITRDKYRGKKIFFHYGGSYDFKFLLEGLVSRCKHLKIIDAGSRIIQIAYSINGRNFSYLVDSFNLLPMAQKKIAEGFGVAHQKKEIDFEKLKEKDFYSEEMYERLKNDCIGLHEIITKFSNWGLHENKLKLTLASQSLFVFKDRFCKENLISLSKENEEFIRSGYYGGRVEVFKRHGKNLKYYDVNSLYPFVMLNDMPCGKAIKTRHYKEGKIGFYDCFVESDLDVGFISKVIDGKLIFPKGKFQAFLSSAEIEECKKSGIKFEIRRGLFFRKSLPIYKEYILALYKIKKSSSYGSIDYIISKFEMNALYGKHGQRREREEVIFTNDFSKIRKEHLIPYYEELGIYKKKTISRSGDIHPYLSSYVTSLARLHLWRLMKLVDFKNVWYTDTDSIITDQDLPTGDELGELKLEYQIKEGIFLLPKVYALKTDDGEVIKIKGFRDYNLKFINFKQSLNNESLTCLSSKGYRILGYKENLKRFGSLKINRQAVTKTLKSEYNKRIILSDQINTEAITLNERI